MRQTALAAALEGSADALAELAELPLDAAPLHELRECERVWLVGTGTSQHAAELGALLFAEAGVDARAVASAPFALLTPIRSGDGVVVISHTAETAFAQRARERAKAEARALMTITGRVGRWPEAIETLAPERSETYTTSYLAALLVLARSANVLGAESITADGLREAIADVRSVLSGPSPLRLSPPERALVVAGIGPAAVTAREGALKVREASGILAEGFDADYLLHGSAVPLDRRDVLVLVDPGADATGLVAAIGAAARTEGVTVHAVDAPARRHPVLDQFALTAAFQRLALDLALSLGSDPDTVIRGAWADEQLWRLGAA